MPNHPNRKGRIGIPPSSPTPDQVRDVRLAAGLTQTEAATEIYASLRAWQDWEGGQRTMPAAGWELFLIKLSWRGIGLPPAFRRHIMKIYATPR